MNSRFIAIFTGPALAGLALLALLDASAKGAVILLFAAIAALLMRRASAASRHHVWLCALACALVLPLASWLLPQWRVLPGWMRWEELPKRLAATPLSQTESAQMTMEATTSTPSAPMFDKLPATSSLPVSSDSANLHPASRTSYAPFRLDARWLLGAWACGSVVLLLPLAFSAFALGQKCRRTQIVRDGALAEATVRAQSDLGFRQQVRVLLGEREAMPMVWGVFRPCLLLPADAVEWTPQRLRAVLLHELAHLRRRDPLWQLVAHCGLALHWFNPLAWVAVRRLRIEQERACDDFVLRAGIRASEYAADMLAIVGSLRPAPFSAAALTMANLARLEGRITGILDGARNRRALTGWIAAAAIFIAIAIAIPVAMLRAADEKKIATGADEPKAPGIANVTGIVTTSDSAEISVDEKRGGLVFVIGEGAQARLIVHEFGSATGKIVFRVSADDRQGKWWDQARVVRESEGEALFPELPEDWLPRGRVVLLSTPMKRNDGTVVFAEIESASGKMPLATRAATPGEIENATYREIPRTCPESVIAFDCRIHALAARAPAKTVMLPAMAAQDLTGSPRGALSFPYITLRAGLPGKFDRMGGRAEQVKVTATMEGGRVHVAGTALIRLVDGKYASAAEALRQSEVFSEEHNMAVPGKRLEAEFSATLGSNDALVVPIASEGMFPETLVASMTALSRRVSRLRWQPPGTRSAIELDGWVLTWPRAEQAWFASNFDYQGLLIETHLKMRKDTSRKGITTSEAVGTLTQDEVERLLAGFRQRPDVTAERVEPFLAKQNTSAFSATEDRTHFSAAGEGASVLPWADERSVSLNLKWDAPVLPHMSASDGYGLTSGTSLCMLLPGPADPEKIRMLVLRCVDPDAARRDKPVVEARPPAPAAGKLRSAAATGRYDLGGGRTLYVCKPKEEQQRFSVFWPTMAHWPKCDVTIFPNVAKGANWAVVWEPGTEVLWWADDSDVGKVRITDPANVIMDREGRENNFSRGFGLTEEVKEEFRNLGFVIGRDKTPGRELLIGGNTGGQKILSAQTQAVWSVDGVVTDADGKPLADVPIIARTEYRPTLDLATVKTGVDGRYRVAFPLDLETLARFRGIEVRPVLAGFTERELANNGAFNALLFADEQPQRVPHPNSQIDEEFKPGPIPRFAPHDLVLEQPGRADFVMLAAGEIVGRIVTAEGAPLPNYFISLAAPQQLVGYSVASTSSDERGQFRLAGIPTNQPLIFTVNPGGNPSETIKSAPEEFQKPAVIHVQIVVPPPDSDGPLKIERTEGGSAAAASGSHKTPAPRAAAQSSSGEEVLDGIGAIVNDEIITSAQMRELVGPLEKAVREQYKGSELVEKLKEIRLKAISDWIDRRELERAEATLTRLSKLYADKLVGVQELDEARARVEVLKAEVAGDKTAANRARLAQAERELQRTTELFSQRAISQQEVDEARMKVEVLKAEIAGDTAAANRARLAHAETKLQRSVELLNQRAISQQEVDEARANVEVLKAEIGGDKTAADRARLAQAEAELRRAMDLQNQKLISQQEVDTARAKLEVLKAEIAGDKTAADRARLAQAEAELRRVEELHNQKLVSSELLDQARAAVEIRKAELSGDRTAAARAQLAQAEAQLKRVTALREQKLISEAEYESAKMAVQVANAANEEAKAPPAKQSESPIVVEIHADGTIHIGEKKFTITELETHLAKLRLENPALAVALVANKTVDYASVNAALDVVKKAGIGNTALQAAPSASDNAPAQQKWIAVGRVTDKDGKPMEGVLISVDAGMGTLFQTGKAMTGTDGRYTVEFSQGMMMEKDSPGLQFANVTARKPRFFEKNLNRHGAGAMALREVAAEDLKGYGVAAGALALPAQPRTVGFVMLPAARIKGRLLGTGSFSRLTPQQVRDQRPGEEKLVAGYVQLDHAPLAGWQLWLKGKALPPGASVICTTRTDKDGNFVMEDVPTGFEWQFLGETNRADVREVLSPQFFKLRNAGDYSISLELPEKQDGFELIEISSDGVLKTDNMLELSTFENAR